MTTGIESMTQGCEGGILGGFRRIAVVGSGAQGKVWKAECVEDVHGIVAPGTVVALKIKYEHGDDADDAWERLSARVDELKALVHVNVVRYLGCFRECGGEVERHVVVQELLEGTTLRERLDAENKWNVSQRRVGLDVDEALDIIRQVSAGLGYCASRGICHRDVKPGNIFICSDGKVKLIDFGVAKQNGGTVTAEGNIRGSWNYLAPDFTDEAFRGDERSDVFSAGVVFHEILTGRLPYAKLTGDDITAYFSRWGKGLADGSPMRIAKGLRRLLKEVDAVFDGSLAPSPDERFGGFGEMLKALAVVRFIERRHGGRTYRILRKIGEGGFGVVFKARWLEENRTVALKVLKDPDSAQRFRTEAKVMQEFDDTCFVKFIDFFETGGRAIIVMDYLDGMPGSSLRDAIFRSSVDAKLHGGDGGMAKDMVFAAFERYARGLAVLHRHDPPIVHRDVKPSNLYYPEGHIERVAIMDFGIVRLGSTNTVSGVVPCTLDYTPPEVALSADRGGPGMDIYALGLSMYEALTGKPAFPRLTGETRGIIDFLKRCRERVEPDFSDPRVASDPELLALLRGMTEADPAKRIGDASAVATELRRLFYREVEDADCPETMALDPVTAATTAIDEELLKAWYRGRPAEDPAQERRILDMCREEWMRSGKPPVSMSMRELNRRSPKRGGAWAAGAGLAALIAAAAAAFWLVAGNRSDEPTAPGGVVKTFEPPMFVEAPDAPPQPEQVPKPEQAPENESAPEVEEEEFVLDATVAEAPELVLPPTPDTAEADLPVVPASQESEETPPPPAADAAKVEPPAAVEPPPAAAATAEQEPPASQTVLESGKDATVRLAPGVDMEFAWCADGFWMAKTETTQRQWKALMEADASVHRGDDLPVENVSLAECKLFARLMSKQTGLDVSVPTPRQWEAACRAGGKARFSWGNSPYTGSGETGGNFMADGMGEETTVRVGAYPANAWGLHDMHGNVAEWCSDGTLRGGGYASEAGDCAVRSSVTPPKGFKNGNSGFRVCIARSSREENVK